MLQTISAIPFHSKFHSTFPAFRTLFPCRSPYPPRKSPGLTNTSPYHFHTMFHIHLSKAYTQHTLIADLP